jgi:DNA-binding GntR family transcriptional regulator
MEKLKKIERSETLQVQAYENIKGLLVAGRLKFGKIYSASQFAEMLGVSRTPAREALLQLAAEGWLSPVQGRGFKLREFTQEEVRDFFEARLMIETYVIERLVERIGQKDLRALEDSLKQMVHYARGRDASGFLDADKAFHMNLVYRYKNRLLESVMDNIRNLISILGERALSRPGRTEEVVREHQEILDALRRRDPKEAAAAVKRHLDSTEKTIIDIL